MTGMCTFSFSLTSPRNLNLMIEENMNERLTAGVLSVKPHKHVIQ